MSFILVGGKRCPTCGIKGKKWMKKPKVYVCPKCNMFFNEFGIVVDSQKEREDAFT